MIKKIAILGSGVMGSAIAAHIASANLKVILLDIASPLESDRNLVSKKAKLSILEKKLLINDSYINNIEIGNFEDDLDKLAQADLIIEVIIENLLLKANLYKKISNFIKKNAIIASNTSTIPLANLTSNLPLEIKQRFFITHFFNPPRYMKLLELVYNENSNIKILKTLKIFLDKNLGKSVVIYNDTPGFIANRIGCYFLEIALREAINSNITAEEADNAIISFGIPKTGIFGLWDLIGIDLMPLITKSITSALPNTDAYCIDTKPIDIIERMIKLGIKGRKSGQGFYKILKSENNKILLSLDFETLTYKPVKNDLIKLHFLDILDSEDKIHIFAKKIIFKTLAYAAIIVPFATNNIHDVDQAMKNGYSWQYGPFELIDKIGIKTLISYLKQNNIEVPKILQNSKNQNFYHLDSYLADNNKYKKISKEYNYITLNSLRTKEYMLSNDSGYLVDIGNNVACLILKNKLGILNYEALSIIDNAITYITKSNFTSLVISTEGEHFSAGADLKFIYENIKINNTNNIANYIKFGQQVMNNIKNSLFPIVIAHKGMALGGGAELLLHADFVCSHIEAQFGLVETKIGLVPGWGGIKEILLKCNNNDQNINNIFLNLITGHRTNNATTIKNDFLFHNLSIHMNADRLVHFAKQKATLLAKKQKQNKTLLKESSINIQKLSILIDSLQLKEHQHYIASKILEIFEEFSLKNNLTEIDINNLEKQLFLNLALNNKTKNRYFFTKRYIY